MTLPTGRYEVPVKNRNYYTTIISTFRKNERRPVFVCHTMRFYIFKGEDPKEVGCG